MVSLPLSNLLVVSLEQAVAAPLYERWFGPCPEQELEIAEQSLAVVAGRS